MRRGFVVGILVLMLSISRLGATANLRVDAATTDHAGPFSYEAAAEITVVGTVSGLLQRAAPGTVMGPHLLLKTSSGLLDASLGMFALRGEHPVPVEAGQSIRVTGVMRTVNSQQVFLARSLEVAGRVYAVRNERGVPLSPEARRRLENPATEKVVTDSSGQQEVAAYIEAIGGTPQSTTIGTPFAAPLVVEVLDRNKKPVSGAIVKFTAPKTGASGTFKGGVQTATTDANGIANSPIFTANKIAGGPYVVEGTVGGLKADAGFKLTNTLLPVVPVNFSFLLSGQENVQDSPYFYALAGVVRIDANSGNVLGGEQDYNDGSGTTGLASPEPSGDAITGGTLAVNAATGQGKLTLNTSNKALGAKGSETLAVQFVNSKHALVTQFDGTATSSGSMDLQSLPQTLKGSFSFSLSGVDSNYLPVVNGGVFTAGGVTETSDGVLEDGLLDTNDAGLLTRGVAFGGAGASISAFDSFGRGTITGTGFATTIKYYVLGPETIRLINVDSKDSSIGSAFGQGVKKSSESSSLVLGIANTPLGNPFAVTGIVNPDYELGTFTGVADDDEQGTTCPSSGNGNPCPVSIAGSYTAGSNGYGSLTIPLSSAGNSQLGDVQTLGIYAVDPALNIADPNNTVSGLGGALVTELDSALPGTGFLVPETQGATSDFAGNYGFAAQGFNNDLDTEFDFVGQGSVSASALTGTGVLSDPFLGFSANPTESGVAFSGTATPDSQLSGRYTMPLNLTLSASSGGENINLNTIVYQASGGFLFWMEEDGDMVFLGTLEQQSDARTPFEKRKAISQRKLKAELRIQLRTMGSGELIE